MDATSNSTSSSLSPTGRWDVFLSFRGKDTRRNFIAHLYKSMDQAGILTFRDDPALEKGEQISPALFQAIKDSKMFVVVLSKNYAYSPWCLNELVEILSCRRINGQVVIPVYYYVNPSDVRYQKASFGEALDVHKNMKRYSDDMMDKWKSALAEIGEISGYHLSKDANEDEADTIQNIVEDVAPPKILHLEEYVFGIDSAVESIHLKLKMESNDVRAIVIWGTGGIGKTTTAKAFFNKYSGKFGISCFIENVKQYSLLSSLEQMLIELLRKKDYKVPNLESGITKLKQILGSKKALVVLDDLDESELLVKLCNLFSPGSRIIITARNARLQNKLKVDISRVDIYEVKGLGEIESLELFSYNAFRKTVPPESFRELSERFVTYAGGLPLALKLLGSSLRGETEVSVWKTKLEIVLETPETYIKTIFQQSYDGLDNENQKTIFLDIAFFFVGQDKDEAVHIFNSCGFSPDIEILNLVNRCLLKIDEDNKFQMHNLIQDMGRELGKRKRLFCQGNAWQDLQNLERTDKIEGLVIDLTMSTNRQMSAKIFEWLLILSTWSTNRQMSAKIFERLPNLRLLQIIGALDIQGNFKNLFSELRCIRWSHCPWTSLPSDFCPPKLVYLDMSSSKLKILWKDAMPLVNLKTIYLRDCGSLKRLPDQLGDMKGLRKLDVSWSGIEQLPDSIAELKELVELKLFDCNKLKKLPEQIGNMEGLRKLDVSWSGIQQLPDSIAELKELVELELINCNKLKKLPDQIGNMEGLRKLDVSCTAIEQLPDSIAELKELVELELIDCNKLKKLPEQIGNMEGLRKLDVSRTAIEQLPDSIAELKELVELNLYDCNKLKKLPEQLGDMEGLSTFDASFTAIEQLPDSFGRLVNLVDLKLVCCYNLTSLPNSICKLKLLKLLHLDGCEKLKRLPEQLGKMQCLEELKASLTAIEELPDSIVLLSNLRVLRLTCCWKLKKLPEQLGRMQGLKVLHLHYSGIEELPESVGLLTNLQELNSYGCRKLRYLPNSLRNLQSFQHFHVGNAKFREI